MRNALLAIMALFLTAETQAQYFEYNEIWDIDRATGKDNISRIADINGDGLDDVIVASLENSSKLVAFINTGSNLDSLVVLGQLVEVHSFTTGDYDNDGDVDIIVSDSRKLYIYTNDGTGAYTSSLITSLSNDLYGLESGDIDGDGLLDIAFPDGQTLVSWRKNLGSNTFSSSDTLSYPVGVSSVSEIALRDVDSDNDLDLISKGVSSWNLNYFISLNRGSLYMDSIIQLFGTTNSISVATFDDFNGDGFIDYAAVNDQDVGFVYTNGSSFSTQTLVHTFSSLHDVSAIYSGDVSGDGVADIIVGETPGSGHGGRTRVFSNNGSGTFSAYGEMFGQSIYRANTTRSNGGKQEIKVLDFDQDGLMDILASSDRDGDIIAYYQKADTTFTFEYLNLQQGIITRLQYFDVNEDGHKDIVSFSDHSSPAVGKAIVSYGNGSGKFTRDTVLHDNIFHYPKDLYLTHWNNNTNADYIYANSNQIFLRLDFNTPQDTTIVLFTDDPGASYGNIGSGTNYFEPLRVHDIDSDGDVDIFVPVQWSGGHDNARWIENAGGFAYTVHYVSTGRFKGHEMGDVNGDDLVDLVLTRIRSTSEAIVEIYFFNAGLNNFVSAKRDTVPSQSGVQFAIADPDNDGDNDIVIGQSWLENTNGSGAFAKDTILSSDLIWNGDMIAADLNSDGLVDFIQDMAPVINQGGNQFTKLPIIQNVHQQTFIAADIDANGYNDIVTVNDQFGTFKPIWYRTCFASYDTTAISACDSLISPSGRHAWHTSGQYVDTLVNALGCDSILTINVTINQPTTGSETITACDSYTWSANSQTYTASGVYVDTLINALGCDSVAILDITINSSTAGTDMMTACDTYTWIDGNTYTSSNNAATHVLTNAAGCDSVVTLDLTINNSTAGADVVTACDSYTWIDGNNYTSSNNTATHTLTNAMGCDSIVSLDLTINNSTVGTDIITACDSYTWIDGTTYTSSNNAAIHTLTNSVGCDSVVTLNLTINNSTTGTDVITTCGSYTWIDGNSYTSSNNTATHTLTSSAGCDSVVTLDLTINNFTTGTDIITACDSYTWIDGNTYTSSNNTATHTLTSSAGCDSVVTLDLTINNVDTSVNQSGISLTADAASASYQWLDCGNAYAALSGETGQSFTASANGTYAVEITENNCVDTSACFAINSVGLPSFPLEGLRIYPNPSSDKVTVELPKSLEFSLKLYDVGGKLIFLEAKVQGEYQLDLSRYAKGLYHVYLQGDSGQMSEWIVKE